MPTIEAPAPAPIVDRVTTTSGSVYEFAWNDPTWPEHGHREGFVRKSGGTWAPIRMVSVGFEIGAGMFWIREGDYFVHTSRIVAAEAVRP